METEKQKLFPHDYLLKYTLVAITPRWIKPNYITILRLAMTPVVTWFMIFGRYKEGVILFLLAAITDAWDGSLARVRGQITVWGQTYDPLADKLLVGSMFVAVALGPMPLLTLLMIGIDFSFVIAAWYWLRKGFEVKANWWGKIKMFLQVLGLVILIIAILLQSAWLYNLSGAVFIAAMGFAVISLITHGI